MTEADGFTLETASAFGFETTNDDADEYKCTEAQLLNFAKSCERKGMADARATAIDIKNNRSVAHFIHDFQAGFKHGAFVVENRLNERIAELDAYLKPIVEAERQRYLTARGHVPIDPAKPEGGWVKKPEPLCDDEGCPQHGTSHVCVHRDDRFDGKLAAEAASKIFDYADYNLTMYDACCDEVPQIALDIYNAAETLRDLLVKKCS